jgi:hypothetical protein
VVGVARFSLISLVALGAALGISMLALLHQPRSEGGSSPGALGTQREHVASPPTIARLALLDPPGCTLCSQAAGAQRA